MACSSDKGALIATRQALIESCGPATRSLACLFFLGPVLATGYGKDLISPVLLGPALATGYGKDLISPCLAFVCVRQ